MRELRIYFINPFRTANPLSWANFRKFAEAHLGRISNPEAPALVAALVADTAAAFTAVFGKLSDQTVGQAVQEAMTRANDLRMDEFKEVVRRKEAAIVSKFPKDSAEYQAFFPQGMGQYRNMTKSEAGPIMAQLVAATQTHPAELEPGLADLIKAHADAVLATRTGQLSQKGIVDETAQEARTLRRKLEDVLYNNILIIAQAYPDNPEAALIYFDQSMTRDKKAGSADAVPPTP